jgi:Arc/MetJ family transcription regulator
VRVEKALARKNLMVDEEAVRTLKRVLGVSTESEAVRIAVRDRLASEEAQVALRRIRTRGGVDDVFQRSVPDLRRRPQ